MSLVDRLFGGRRARYERALDELAEALSAGRHRDAIARGHEAVALAVALHGSKSAALSLPMYGLASALVAEGDFGEAEAVLRQALDELDAPAANAEVAPRTRLLEMLASIVLRGGADVDATETLLRRWVLACRAEPEEPLRLASALNQLGLLLGRRDKRDEARAVFDEAEALRREALGEGREVAEIVFNAATFRPSSEGAERVREALAAAAAMIEKDASTEAQTLLASILHNEGAALEELGDADGARERFARSLAIREGVVGRDDASLRPTLVRLAQRHHRDGNILFALPLYERALTIATRELGAEHPIVRAIEAWKRELTEGGP